ncbi:hypothetical protein F441_20396 [Phytophthora nicotianae CJ01A1]|uniref:Uncharacterized protein n=3 Tax=Phytophthora nicotianae TaxID=4792 RepID=V9FW73_PHYNI|nr:hypothetical protein F443_01610 [Phytophthora nicotianae P1569]ETK95559.1 hypothetical protein L915_01526 [Phytophthora nicotianae]ETM01989.1 hypothetical protein L917_01481 [Phytophthora nicotianae]ETM30863.1 hypothetical protein L914_21463 [Phytophthora nicotianae]ETP02549.1 hypothetical protein F441_20396 [Phytophthora nicotianae CJ01A1]
MTPSASKKRYASRADPPSKRLCYSHPDSSNEVVGSEIPGTIKTETTAASAKGNEESDAAVEPTTAVVSYVPPLERLQHLCAQQTAEQETVNTVEGLLRFIEANDVIHSAVRARLRVIAKVVWASTHVVKTGEIARIHIVDEKAPETFDVMQRAFRDDYSRDYLAVDQLLITATVFGCTGDSPGIPPDGAIVTINNPSKVNLLMDKSCQLTIRLANLTFEQ